MTLVRSIAGVCLLLFALAVLTVLPFLPSRGADGLQLPFLTTDGPPVVMAFAGFPGCGDTCPVSLQTLGTSYRLMGAPPLVGLQFVNIDPHSSATHAEVFARGFHPAFRTWSVALDERELLYRRLGLRTVDPATGDRAHGGTVFVFTRAGRTWRIERTYRQIPDPDRLRQDILELLETNRGSGHV